MICPEDKMPAIQEDLKLLDGPVCSQSYLLYGGVVPLCRAKPVVRVLHRGYLLSDRACRSTAPRPSSDASVCRIKGKSGFTSCNTGSPTNASRSLRKALSASSVQGTGEFITQFRGGHLLQRGSDSIEMGNEPLVATDTSQE